MLEKKYIAILEKVIQFYKDYEHEKLKEIKGTEIDILIKGTEDYIKRLKELREQIEKRAQEKTIEQIHKDVFELLGTILGKKSQSVMINEFEKNLVKTGKFTQQHLRILKDIVTARAEFKKGKSTSHKIDEARKNAMILINELIEYSQRKDMVSLEKGRMRLKYMVGNKPQTAELLTTNGQSFLFLGKVIKRITNKVESSSMQEVSKAVAQQKDKEKVEINPRVFELLKDELGEFQIVL